MNKTFPKVFSFALILALVISAMPGASVRQVQALSADIVISQIYGGGGNTGAPYRNDFIELFNRGTTTVSLAGMSVQYASAIGTGNFGGNPVTPLSGNLAPGQYYLVQQASGGANGVLLPTADAIGTVNMSGTAGKVALVNSTSGLACNGGSTPCSPAQLALIKDLVGYGNANFFESNPVPTLTNSTAAIRNGGGSIETDNNAADFTVGAPTPRNSQYPNPYGTGSTGSAGLLSPGDTVLLLVAVTPGASPSSGFTVICNLSTIGGDSAQVFYDDGTHGDVLANDNVFSFNANVVSVNGKSIACTVSDSQGKSGSATILLNVILPIGIVQGSVDDTANGLTFASPFVGQTVFVKGVIYEKTQEYRSAGGAFYGFFLQNTADTVDGDPNSSDGIFVFHSTFLTLLVDGGGSYAPQVGDEVILRGPVEERFNNTRLNNPRLVQVVRSGVVLDGEIPAFEVNPQADIEDDIQDAYRYWERHEGMRAQVPANSIILDGRDVFPSTFDSEVWVARADSLIAQQTDPYARRSFRDPHPLDDIPTVDFDNGNPYRILMGGFGFKATANDTTALLAPARTYDVLTNSPVGGVYFNFGKYSVQVQQQLILTPGVDPALNAPPQAFDRNQEFSLAPYNVENLYDWRDDPFDGCDFTGNLGCPGVTPPFDYVPASQAVYAAHVNDIAQQIIADLHGPDIIFVQEAEDQDICTVTAGIMDCDLTTNNTKSDGKPDTLQELALRITALNGPAYDAVYDRNGADDRGIVSAFLYRTDRVELLPASAADPVLGSSPTVSYPGTALAYNTDVQNPKALNADLPGYVDLSTGFDGTNVFTRPPQVGLFRIWQDAVGSGTSLDLYALSNHFSSTPNARVGQRTEQALYDAAIVDALQTANPDVMVAVAGDFNVYPRPDDPFAPGDLLFPSDQLAPLYDQGLLNLFDVLVAEVPVSAYSYIFQGQTQTLDQIFVTPSLMDELVQARAAHVNSDWPADYDGDGPRGASDHDPLVARFCRDVTAPEVNITLSDDTLWPANHKYVTVTATVDVTDDADPAPIVTLVSVTSNEPDDGDDDGNTVDDIVIVDDFTFKLRAERSGVGTGRVYTITYMVTDACGNSTTATATVTVPLSQGN